MERMAKVIRDLFKIKPKRRISGKSKRKSKKASKK